MKTEEVYRFGVGGSIYKLERLIGMVGVYFLKKKNIYKDQLISYIYKVNEEKKLQTYKEKKIVKKSESEKYDKLAVENAIEYLKSEE